MHNSRACMSEQAAHALLFDLLFSSRHFTFLRSNSPSHCRQGGLQGREQHYPNSVQPAWRGGPCLLRHTVRAWLNSHCHLPGTQTRTLILTQHTGGSTLYPLLLWKLWGLLRLPVTIWSWLKPPKLPKGRTFWDASFCCLPNYSGSTISEQSRSEYTTDRKIRNSKERFRRRK